MAVARTTEHRELALRLELGWKPGSSERYGRVSAGQAGGGANGERLLEKAIGQVRSSGSWDNDEATQKRIAGQSADSSQDARGCFESA